MALFFPCKRVSHQVRTEAVNIPQVLYAEVTRTVMLSRLGHSRSAVSPAMRLPSSLEQMLTSSPFTSESSKKTADCRRISSMTLGRLCCCCASGTSRCRSPNSRPGGVWRPGRFSSSRSSLGRGGASSDGSLSPTSTRRESSGDGSRLRVVELRSRPSMMQLSIFIRFRMNWILGKVLCWPT